MADRLLWRNCERIDWFQEKLERQKQRSLLGGMERTLQERAKFACINKEQPHNERACCGIHFDGHVGEIIQNGFCTAM